MNHTCQLILITHGNLGCVMLDTAQQFTGIHHVIVISIKDDDEVQRLKNQLQETIEKYPDIVILTDMIMGSPTILAAQSLSRNKVNIISGMNLHMLIEAMKHCDIMDGSTLTQHLLSQGKEDIDWINQKLEELSHPEQED